MKNKLPVYLGLFKDVLIVESIKKRIEFIATRLLITVK